MLTSLYSFSLKNAFHPLCYLKRALFRLGNYPEFSRLFLCGQRYWLEDTKRNTLDISDFRNQVHHRMFFKEYMTAVHLDRHLLDSNYLH